VYKRLKSDESGLTAIELTIIMVVISGILILTAFAVPMVLVIPKFTVVFNDLGVELPLPTRILIGTTDAFQAYWWMGLLVVIVGTVGLKQYIRLETSQVWLNRLRHKLSLKHLTISIGLYVVLMGAIIGFIAVAMILPIFEANQLLSG
jgi:MSHA biogenesis protein MshG